ncbi:MAG: hypothetical protein J0M00_21020 [Burkholderiales bacterium]|nr:hypothetical protein [Burkholderiales bacterium]
MLTGTTKLRTSEGIAPLFGALTDVGTFSVTQASEARAGKLPVLCRKGYVPSSVLGVAALVP